jgi:hypothetical protein
MGELLGEILMMVIAEKVCWAIGAGLKKIAGRPLSETGSGEELLGFLFLVFLVFASSVYLSAHR